jgi:hypothetical protein
MGQQNVSNRQASLCIIREGKGSLSSLCFPLSFICYFVDIVRDSKYCNTTMVPRHTLWSGLPVPFHSTALFKSRSTAVPPTQMPLTYLKGCRDIIRHKIPFRGCYPCSLGSFTAHVFCWTTNIYIYTYIYVYIYIHTHTHTHTHTYIHI